ncbi:hypothetical protein CW702_02830 [Candidatus Bathyarchaeota archaeon]|nr:MAG: hypothetical protein CW702_02830 [Candidatus Bathyarchaeota archaeon]
MKEFAAEENFTVLIPENFYSLVAERHIKTPKLPRRTTKLEIEEKVSDLPETESLYYKDQYMAEFDAKVLRVLEGKTVVLDKTAFYPEGGGQPSDKGYLQFRGQKCRVLNVQKVGKVILHEIEGPPPMEGETVHGIIDWDRRLSLMRHHTATHLLLGAARRVLGEHVWQAGAQKGTERSRLDISHYRRLSLREIHQIEKLANMAVMMNMPVKAFWMAREEAERRFGFRLYQGGVVPGRVIRVVKSGDWDVEACGGTHCKSTGEVGFIKIVHTERVQDGVERIIFSAGLPAIKAVQEEELKIHEISNVLNVPFDRVDKAVGNLVSEWRALRQERDRLLDTLSSFVADRLSEEAIKIGEIKVIIQNMKETPIDQLIKVANTLVSREPKAIVALFHEGRNARFVVTVGDEVIKRGLTADEIAREAAAPLGGGGSGRPNFAQGGGVNTDKIPEAIKRTVAFLKAKLEKVRR